MKTDATRTWSPARAAAHGPGVSARAAWAASGRPEPGTQRREARQRCPSPRNVPLTCPQTYVGYKPCSRFCS